jgi:thiosulfate dehydrogenase (quinone) large subunit
LGKRDLVKMKRKAYHLDMICITCKSIWMSKKDIVTQIPEPPIAKFLFADTRLGIVWLLLRIYVGWIWLEAGWGKITSPMWVGPKAGVAVAGFAHGALAKTAGAHPDVAGWYAMWVKDIVIPNAAVFSRIVAYGELLVGIGLILGIFTGISAFFGAFLNMNYLFAGTVSVNPLMVVIQLALILAWRVAGWLGFDRFVLPFLGTPWQPGSVFKKK